MSTWERSNLCTTLDPDSGYVHMWMGSLRSREEACCLADPAGDACHGYDHKNSIFYMLSIALTVSTGVH